jgi:hypothetical protein
VAHQKYLDGAVYAMESLMNILVVVPWVLTVLLLLLIIYIQNKNGVDFDDHFDLDNEDLIPDWVNEDSMGVIRVAVVDDKAYWVKNNVFYEAEVISEPDFSTAQPIDTMSLSKRKLNELLIILDELEAYGEE